MLNNNKPGVAILFTESAKCNRKLPFKKSSANKVYSVFAKKAEAHGMNAFFAKYDSYEKGKLKSCWYFDKEWKKASNQEIDIVYSRFAATIYKNNKKDKLAERFKYKMAKEITLMNHPILDEFCWDKRIIAEVFPEHNPKTFLVNTLRGLKIVLPEIKSKMVVIKPRYGTLGKEVIITEKTNLPEKIDKNTIVQEFIDTSKGIKRITKQTHDMRVIVANGKIDHAFIRIPKKGLLTANVSLGGKKIFIDKKLIPTRAIKVIKKVDDLFKKVYPRLYSVDLMFNTKGKPYIVECNSQPMIDKYAFGRYADTSFYDRLFETIKVSIPIKIVEKV